jgi:diguanylate cyclase (GGDEF)-like protein
MTGSVPPAAAARLLAATADVVLLVEDGRIVRSWPDALPAGLPLAQLVHPDDDLPLPPPPGTVARLRLQGGDHRWCEVTGTQDPGGTDEPGGACWLAVHDAHQRIERERDLERRLRQTLQAVDATIDGLAVYRARRDAGGAVTRLELTFINAAGARGFAGDRASLVGRDLTEFLPNSRENGLWNALVAALESGQPVLVRLQGSGEPGSGVTDSIQARLDADTVVSSWRDVTEMVQQQELLARAYDETASARAALQAALDATSDSFAVYGLERNESGGVERIVVRLANTAAAEPLGFSPDDLVGHDLLDAFPDLRSCGLWEAIVDSADSGEGRRHRVHVQDGDGVWQASFDNTIAPVGEDEVVVTWRDVTRDEQGRRHLEQTRSQAEHAATHDHLTGLPNRALLEHRLQEALDAPGEGLVGVVFCDLDEFKAVNDTYGHLAGDLVLTAVAQRLHLLTRHGETAARLSGDEFVLLLRDLPARWRAEEFLRRADRAVRRPVDVGPALVTPSASLGVVLVDPRGDERSPKALLEQADRAMYQVKRQRSAVQTSGTGHP